ncbi:DUF3806 domain-containing protein [Haliea sp. E17]|uniref:DUF3806 domain-containing protein n=1 Tax=Haliea sp. E17 TaxID=3401576 RepID=UPI003AAAD6DE
MNPRHNPILVLLAVLYLLPLATRADEPVIEDLTAIDRQYLNNQRASIEDIVASNYGARISGDRERDIALLQRVLDERLVRNDQARQLQAMGVILGDLLAADLGMHWVVYRDKLGRSHALRYLDSDIYLFPVTMISRRREVGNLTPVAEIYTDVAQDTRKALPAKPFTAP